MPTANMNNGFFDPIIKQIVHNLPNLKRNLWIAQINQSPEDYVKDKLTTSLFVQFLCQ